MLPPGTVVPTLEILPWVPTIMPVLDGLPVKELVHLVGLKVFTREEIAEYLS